PPELHAVTFPKGGYDLPTAKKLLAVNLGELPLSPSTGWLKWSQMEERLLVSFCEEAYQQSESIVLEQGVIETVFPLTKEGKTTWPTARLEFPLRDGWSWCSASTWVSANINLHDAGRCGYLTENWRVGVAQLRVLNHLLTIHGLPPCRSPGN